jgi:uncharacterized protein YecE (DUF72 family)
MAAQEILPLQAPQFDFQAAAKLPSLIRFGGSSWTYRGWSNIIYFSSYKNEREFKRNCLGEYAKFPWFRTVGIDSAFYSPLSSKLLHEYAAQVPANFQWVSKVWERITIPTYPQHARYGSWAGRENPDFLNADLFVREVLTPYSEPALRAHCGPFVFQFPTISKTLLAKINFFGQLEVFLGKLPKEFRYAVEVRNPDFLKPEYFQILNAHTATHCFNHWHIMPPLRVQMHRAAEGGGLKANFFVARILTPLGVSYEGAVKLFQPYNQLKQPNPEMREDAVRLAKRALERNADSFIIVNNRAEGHSPGTIDAIGRMIVSEI